MKTAMDRRLVNAVADKEHISKQGKRDLNGPVIVTLWITQFGGVTTQSHLCPTQTVPLWIHTIPLAVHKLLLEVP